MTIYRVHIPFEQKPKPRGGIGKHGNMTHQLNDYSGFQRMFISMLKSTSFQIPPDFHALIFKYNLKPKRGKAPDLSNMQGFIEDALVKSGYLKDDNWKILSRYYTFGVLAEESSIDLFCVMSQIELIHVIKKYDQPLDKDTVT